MEKNIKKSNKLILIKNDRELNSDDFSSIINNKDFQSFAVIRGEALYTELKFKDPKLILLQDNMKLVKNMVLHFCTYNGGIYPEGVNALFKEAKELNYWKNIKSPYSSKAGSKVIMDYKNYIENKQKSSLKGIIVYDYGNCYYKKEDQKNNCTTYTIYATDKNGELLKYNNEILVLEQVIFE